MTGSDTFDRDCLVLVADAPALPAEVGLRFGGILAKQKCPDGRGTRPDPIRLEIVFFFVPDVGFAGHGRFAFRRHLDETEVPSRV
jgi:hypothetical protein